MKKILLILIALPFLATGQNYRLDSITGSNGLLIYSIYDNSGNSIKDYYKFSTIHWKYENTYDINNNRTETIIYENNNGSWEDYMRLTYTYNNNNQLIASETDAPQGTTGSWTNAYQYDYSYNNNDLVLMEQYSWDGGYLEISSKTEYSYTNNNQTLSVTSNWDGSNWIPFGKIERIFSNDNIDSEEYFNYSNGSWTTSYSTDYSYNNYLLSNTIYGMTMADFSLCKNQVTELEYSFGATYTYHYSIYSSITNINDIKHTNKKLLRINDITGRQAKIDANKPLFYIYEDGSVKKRIIIK